MPVFFFYYQYFFFIFGAVGSKKKYADIVSVTAYQINSEKNPIWREKCDVTRSTSLKGNMLNICNKSSINEQVFYLFSLKRLYMQIVF